MAKKKNTTTKKGTYSIRDVANKQIVKNISGNVNLETEKKDSSAGHIRSTADEIIRRNNEKYRKAEAERQRRENLYNRIGTTPVMEAGNRINTAMNQQRRENFIRDTLKIQPKLSAKTPAAGISKPAQAEETSFTGRLIDLSKQINGLEKQKNATVSAGEQQKLQREIDDLKNEQHNWVQSRGHTTTNDMIGMSRKQAESNPNSIINKILQKRGITPAPAASKQSDMQRIKGKGLTNPLDDRNQYISDYNLLQKSGEYKGSDIKLKSTEQLEKELADIRQAIANEPNEDERRKIFEEKDKVKGVYGTLAMNGVPYGYKGEYLQKRPDEYFEDATYQNEYDKTLYDYIYGPGEYEKRIEEAQTDEDIDKLDAELENLWVSIENGSIGDTFVKAQEDAFAAQKAITEKSANEKQAEKIEKELANRKGVQDLMDNVPDVSGAYDPSKIQTYTVEKNIMNQMFLPMQIGAEFQAGDEIDKLYQAVNNPNSPVGETYFFGRNGDTDLSNLAEINPAYFMTQEQIDTFNKYYNAGNKSGAKAFYDALYPYLKSMEQENKQLLIDKMSRNEYAPLMITARALTPEVAAAFGAIGTAKGLIEGKDADEILNSDYYDLTRANQTIQSARADVWGDQFAKWFGEEWREAGEKTNGLLYSVADNVRRAMITKGISGAMGLPMNSAAAKTIDFMMLGSDVLSNQMATNLANGMEPDEAFVRAVGNAAIEVITENMWWDSMFSTDVKDLLGTPGKFAKFMRNSFLQEGAEEVSGNVMDTLFDEFASQLYGHESELDKQYRELVESGVDPAAAKGRVLENWMKEAGWAFLEGGLSALMLSGGRGIAARTSEYRINTEIGGKVLGNGMDKLGSNADAKAIATNELQNEIKLLEAAEKMNPTSDSKEVADEIRKKMKKGKEISKADFGKLARTIYGETNEQIGAIVKNVLQENIVKDLQDAGVADAEKMSEIVAKKVAGAEMTNGEKFALSQDSNALAVAAMYGMGLQKGNVAKAESQIKEEIKNPLSIRETISDMLTSEVDREKAVGDVEKMMNGAQLAGNITRMMNSSKDSTKVEVDGEVLNIEKFITKADKVGNRIYVHLSNGEDVDISEVKGLSENAAKVLRYIQLDNNTFGSNRVAEVLLKHANDTKDAASMVYDAMRVRINTVLGLNTPKNGLSAEMVNEIRQAAQEDFNEAEEKRVQNQRQIRPGKGRAVFNGVVYGTNAFTEAIKKLNRVQRNEAFAIGVIAKAAGLDVELYNDPQNTKEQGSYTAAGGIRINLAGTFNEEGWHRGALATFAHEITHQLEGNSREAYAQLRQFVINNLQKNGENVEQRLRGIMDTYAKNGQQLDLNGAIAELVAKSSEQVLTDENVIRSLRESDPNLYGRIRKVVSSLVERIRTAIGLAKETSSYYSKALGNVADDLSRLWLGAYQEAKQAKGTAVDAAGNEYAFAGTDPETGRSIYVSNYPSGTPQSVKSKALVDLVQNIWSKKPIQLTVTENGKNRKIYAQFDPDYDPTGAKKTDLGKMAHPEMPSASRRRVAMNLSNDYYQILQESDYDSSKPESKDHENVKQWHYFIDDIYYVEQGSNEAEPYRIVVNVKEKNDGSYVYAYYPQRIENEKNKKLSVMGMSPVNTGVMSGESASASTGIVSQQKNYGKSQKSIQEDLDAEYAEAVNNGDWRKAENMLLEKMQNTEGITGYRAPHFYNGEHRDIAKAIKTNADNAMQRAVEDLAPLIPDNAVLIPMPPHEGTVTQDTDTYILANALSEATGRPVVVALESDYHESRYKAKAKGDRSVNAQTMGFRQIADIPADAMPVFIDNMVGGGQTAMAAKNALGRGITLAYAQSSRDKSRGVKDVTVTYDNEGKLIPLSKRMDPNNRSWKYSFQEDEAYMDAVENGNMEEAQRYVKQAAEAAGYDTVNIAYHGTDQIGFTQFDLEKGQQTIFVSFTKSLSGTYTADKDVKRVKDTEIWKKIDKLSEEEFAKFYLEHNKTYLGGELIDVKYNYGKGDQAVYDIQFIDPDTNEPVESIDFKTTMLPDFGKRGGLYELYTRPGRQFVVDAKESMWHSIEVKQITDDIEKNMSRRDIENGAEAEIEFTPREIAEWAYKKGYDSVRINNVYDSGPYGEEGKGFGDIGIFFSEGDVKSADPVTYDDYGDVIPPSDRFRPVNKDIRYSIQDDESYMQAVKSGNMEAAQQYVDTVAKEKGFTEDVYHGTPTGGFTVFKDWSYFTKNKDYADRYQNASASSVRGSYETTNPQTYALKMNPGKVFDTRKPAMARLFNEARAEYGLTALENTNTGLPDWTDGRDLIEFIEDRGLDYDTILLDEGADGGYGEPVVSRGISYVTRNNRVKSAEAVTYDKDGNVVPPSERFNIKQNDIRFSMQEPVEVNRDGLIAVHNLTEQNLLDTLKEGGFTAPSIAIVRAAMGHSKFGDISAVFKPSAIDPMQNSRNKVYGQDAWTPTRSNAEIQYELNGDEMYRARDYILGLLEEVDPLIQTSYNMWANQNIYEEFTNKSIYDWLLEARENPGMLAAYTVDKGGKVENKYRKERINWEIYPEHEQMYRDFLETLDNLDMLDQFMEDMNTKPAGLNLEKWGNVFGESSEKAKKYMDAYQKAEEAGKMTSMKREMLWSKIREAWEYQKDGREIKTQDKLDIYDTAAALSEKIDKNDFDKWFLDLYKKAFGKKGVRNDKDLFTSIGDRRPFSQTHWDATTENIVRAMYANHPSKGGEAGGATGLMAKASKEYRNLDEIRADANRLQMLDEKEYEQKINDLDQKIIEFCQRAWDATGWNTSNIKEVLIEAGEAYAKNPTAATIKKALAGNGLKLPDNLVNEAQQLMEEAREIPTGYFEAKPERVNTFDELETIIIPNDVKQILIDEMDRQGVPYVTYDGTEADRLRVLNQQTAAMFSFMDETELDVGHWMMTVKEDSLQTEAEKQMLKKYKDLRMRLDLREMRKSELRNKIAPIEMIPEAQRSEDQKRQLKKLKDQLGHTQRVIDDTLEELARASSAEGFARMMYQESKVLNNFIYGRTQAEVRDAVEAMEKNAGTVAARIAENQAAIKELEKSGVVQAVKKMLGRTTVEQAAADLKKKYNSTWTRTEILNYLNPIVLKMTQGEDISFDVEELAGILIDSDRTNVYEGLSALRGLTITLGKGQQQELKAQNSSLKEIRRRLAGTGIQVKYGDRSTLEADIESLREEYPEMPDFGNEKDALENFVSWVEGMKRSGADQFYDQNLAEAMAVIMQKAASAMNGIYMPTESKAQKQVLALVEYIKTLNAKTEKLEKNLTEIAADMEKMQKAGANATSMVNVLHRDVNIAIDYYNKMAKIAEDNAKQQKQNKIIEQLKSKHAQQILKNNEEWRNLIERDKQARAQAEDNRLYRNWINRSLRTMYQKLRNPKGMNNIPEYMQGLAREVLETFVDNDLAGGMRFTDKTLTELAEVKRVLEEWKKESGPFNIADINEAEEVVATIISNDLMTIYDGIAKINSEIRGKNRLDTLQQRGEILRQMQEAVTEIWTAIKAENTVQIRNRRIAVEDQAYKIAQLMGNLKKKEWTGKVGKAIATLHKAIISGNMTPEYFFRTLDNEGLSDLWENYHDAENRNGLELKQAQQRLAEIAKQYGYEKWDTKKKFTLTLESGQKVDMTLGQLMSLWATWKREIALGPNVSEHLAGGGFYAEQDTRDGILGKAAQEKRSHRIKVIRNEQGEIVKSPDMDKVSNLLTEDQKKFVDEVVGYMSNDMSELGNEASMAAYGIKLYKEKYYFPFQMWDGVRSRKSNDAGSAAAANDRAFHPSFSKSRIHGARNALVIGDFMQTAADHIAGMINYATMGLANENLQKTLNTQLQQSYGEDEINKRNIWVMMEEAYGQEVVQYLRELQEQLNGGAVRTQKSIGDKAISLFRKNAVAGSLSVALQQPLSYIRAAMMVNPKYLAQALNPIYWKGSYAEMLKHSGVAVIKDMGRFDMNFGQSAREFLMPETKDTGVKKVWDFVTDKATILPELMDRMTWTRMWSAVKAEQKALHPEMDTKSEEFLNMVGERFNEVMRRTQVYDSVLVKSANMRSDNYWIKSLTSFMAEPTLTLNVLADAARQAKNGEKDGKTALAKAGATFMLSAILQAAVKGLMGSGRNPDEKKTWWENYLYRFWNSFMSEADPVQLLPGFSDLVKLMQDGSLDDDAMGAIGKIFQAGQKSVDMLLGKEDLGYRNWEDSAAQLMQIFSGLPLKNLMRDGRAIWNWTVDQPYAKRDSNAGVIKYQTIDSIANGDNLFSVINKWLGEAGWETKNTAYYKRIYEAKKGGREQDAQDMIDYLLKGKGVKESALNSGISTAAKNDTSASASETAEFLIDEGANAESYIREQLKDEKMTPEEARKLLKDADPEKSDDSIWWTVDRIMYAEENNLQSVSGNYYRLWDAMDNNKASEIQTAVKTMMQHGVKPESIKSNITKQYKRAYLEANNAEKTKIRDAIQKAYRAAGYTAEEADKVINKWK